MGILPLHGWARTQACNCGALVACRRKQGSSSGLRSVVGRLAVTPTGVKALAAAGYDVHSHSAKSQPAHESATAREPWRRIRRFRVLRCLDARVQGVARDLGAGQGYGDARPRGWRSPAPRPEPRLCPPGHQRKPLAGAGLTLRSSPARRGTAARWGAPRQSFGPGRAVRGAVQPTGDRAQGLKTLLVSSKVQKSGTRPAARWPFAGASRRRRGGPYRPGWPDGLIAV
jgi:hypothetical protein